MEEKQYTDEMIDRYLSRQMTDSEIADFESQIASNPQLRTEVDLQSRIVRSIKNKNAKKILQEREKHICRTRRRRKNFIRTMSGFAAAACIILGIIHFNGISTYKSYGDKYYASMNIPTSRGGDQIDSLLKVAYEQIGLGEYAQAHENIDNATTQIQNEQFDQSTEEGQYYHKLNLQKMDDAQWLKVIAYMKEGKRRKANKLLKDIASGNGIYKTQAQEILQ